MKVAVIYGGKSPEAKVSIKTKDAVSKALNELGIDYQAIELNRDVAVNLAKLNADIVFNACHGLHGEDGRLPGMLDILEIPYTHSGSAASYIAMDKYSSYEIAVSLGINVAPYEYVWSFDNLSDKALEIMQSPFIIKPNIGGSSLGVYLFKDPKEFKPDSKYFEYGPLIIQKYVAGLEVNVAMFNNKAIGTVQVEVEDGFFDYHAKYESKKTIYKVNADITNLQRDEIFAAATKFHNFIGVNNIARSEFIVSDNQYYFLETNTHPGFTDRSLVPMVAVDQGIEFKDMVKSLLDSAKYD